MLQILLGYIRCDGFFEDASTSFLAVDPILVCLPSLLVNGHLLTILSSCELSKKVGCLSLSSSEVTTFVLSRVVILSLTVGNMRDIRGDLPVVAVCGVKFTNKGLISPFGE